MGIYGVLLSLCCFGRLNGQNWRFPSCDDLVVEAIRIEPEQMQVSMDVYNRCDTCLQHVYTGIVFFHHTDTLAASRSLFSDVSPANNSTHTYLLEMRRTFTLSEVSRMAMVGGVCDSLQFSLLNSPDVSVQQTITVYPNPVKDKLYLSPATGQVITGATVLNLSGTPLTYHASAVSSIRFSTLPQGLYLLRLETTHATIVHKIQVIK